ncbi:hypothetical protein RO3G_10434 partial [Lichtheimia corymbifera JMRC:FSU:9682]|uniref:Mitochondrial outer membrane protein n=1 Tax=Lichtheimia corymbifera JMRC:FSU:9682 TaxID=1263082 RepID=A0A068RNJ7_9FUNG|nr:hypothetical protein RO3G_10434 partial [Lichtheimia corymbifera JMRC:FSU:9682]
MTTRDNYPPATWPALPNFELPAALDFLKLKNFPLKVYPAVYDRPKLQHDTLYIHGPGWRKSSASFDVDCLQIQIYLKFCGINFEVHNGNEPLASPSGKLPFLATVTGAIYDSDRILQWVDEMDKAKKLASTKDQEQAKAFIALARTKLHAAWLFSTWLEPLNYSEYTANAYFSHVPTPVNKLLAYQKQNQVTQTLLTDRDILVREEVYHDAAQTLEALSTKLGDDKYFFGSTEPTWIDAVIFSYLHAIMSYPTIPGSTLGDEEKKQAGELRALVRKHENLVQYAKNIYETWLK